jgi:hypothetical protein
MLNINSLGDFLLFLIGSIIIIASLIVLFSRWIQYLREKKEYKKNKIIINKFFNKFDERMSKLDNFLTRMMNNISLNISFYSMLQQKYQMSDTMCLTTMPPEIQDKTET